MTDTPEQSENDLPLNERLRERAQEGIAERDNTPVLVGFRNGLLVGADELDRTHREIVEELNKRTTRDHLGMDLDDWWLALLDRKLGKVKEGT